MTVQEAAQRLGISDKLCYQIVAEGRLKCVRIGAAGKRGKVVIWTKHLEEFMRKLEAESR
jgi:excisionase family DNA binding protein